MVISSVFGPEPQGAELLAVIRFSARSDTESHTGNLIFFLPSEI
jgi:hypothetical protein